MDVVSLAPGPIFSYVESTVGRSVLSMIAHDIASRSGGAL